MSKWILLAAVVVAAYILWPSSKPEVKPVASSNREEESDESYRISRTQRTTARKADDVQELAQQLQEAIPSALPKQLVTGAAKSPNASPENNPRFRSYTVDGGLAVFDGDIVLGRLRDGEPKSGKAELPEMRLWPTREIPFHIQPSVPNPERVYEALNLFSSTVVKFVPYTDQEDVLVFENGTGVCKSYVGMIGGKQPIWIPQGCEPAEVAHEIMHALGFIHEQNRDDRDQFVQVNVDNIEESAIGNFEKLPSNFMEISGTSHFAFKSVMIYPPGLFSKNGKVTMVSKMQGEAIEPGQQLGSEDVARINIVYGRR